MNKWPKTIKNLRAILSKNQEQFAELVGVSIDLIKSVESGRVKATAKLGLKIQAATGAIIGDAKLVNGKPSSYQPFRNNAVASGWRGRELIPFSKTAFEEHRQSARIDRVDDPARIGDSLPALQFRPHPSNAEDHPGDGGGTDRPCVGIVGAYCSAGN